MILKYIACPAGYPSRAIVEINHCIFRRLSNDRGMMTNWQEKIPTGEFHTIFNHARVEALEIAFLALPPATEKQIQTW